jgi:hypothetical protein
MKTFTKSEKSAGGMNERPIKSIFSDALSFTSSARWARGDRGLPKQTIALPYYSRL